MSFKESYNYVVINWKTTVIGIAKGVNGLYACIQAFSSEHSGIIDPKVVAYFLLFNSILQVLNGIATKDANKGSDRPQEVVDTKLDNVRPFDGVQGTKD